MNRLVTIVLKATEVSVFGLRSSVFGPQVSVVLIKVLAVKDNVGDLCGLKEKL